MRGFICPTTSPNILHIRLGTFTTSYCSSNMHTQVLDKGPALAHRSAGRSSHNPIPTLIQQSLSPHRLESMKRNPIPKAHLLALPRELRDEIYNHLSHDLTLEEIPDTGGVHAKICRAPILNVLLTHSTLYDECLASEIFKRLTITIHRELPPSTSGLMKAILGGALTHVRHVVFTTRNLRWPICYWGIIMR